MQESHNFGNTLASGIEVDDLNFIIRDLQYSSVLDVPFYTRILHQLYSFFGKINVSVTPPSFLGYIYYIIFIIQSYLPSFLIDCKDIWPRESLMSMIIYVLGYTYQGPHTSIKSSRVPMSFIVSLIFYILIFVLIFRAKIFQIIGRVSPAETKFFLFTFKYIMPLFCPHLMSGVAISFDEIINEKKISLNIAQIIFSTIAFVFYMFLFHTVICPRVLLEDTPTHEWIPFLSVVGTVNTTLLTLISGIAGCVNGKNRVGCSIFMLIESAINGAIIFYLNGNIKMIINVITSATNIASAFTSLVLTINLFMSSSLSPEVIFVLSVIVYIIIIIVFKILKQMKITKIMQFLENLMDSRELSHDILRQNYSKPFKFLSDIRSSIELWHPYLLSFDIFEFAVEEWPDNFDVLMFYARILTFLPQKNSRLMLIAGMIAKLPEKSTRNSYLYQFRHLARTRQTIMTKTVQQKLEEVNCKKEIIMALMRQFWENILQKNIVNFWSDSDRVHNHIAELDSILAQLIDDYPNNFKVLQVYLDFVQNLKRDHIEARDMAQKIEILKTNGQIKSDLAVDLAILVFPNLNNYLKAVEQDQVINTNEYENANSILISFENSEQEEFNENQEEIHNNDENKHEENQNEKSHKEEEENIVESKNHTENQTHKNSTEEEEDTEEKLKAKEIDSSSQQDIQIKCAISELTKHSKLGCIWIECIILLLMTILSIVLFYLFYDYYVNKFINKQTKAIDFLQEIDMLVYELNFNTVNMIILPLTFDDSSELIPSLSALDRQKFARDVGPKLWEAGKIPPFGLSTNISVNLLTGVKERFSQMIVSLSMLDREDPYVKKINRMFSEDLTNGLYTIKDIATQELLITQDMLKFTNIRQYFTEDNIFSRMKNYYLLIYQQLSQMASISHDYASLGFESSVDSLCNKMTLAILFTVLLVTLPYLIQLFILKIQSDSIAESFTFFPNTEIRSIINKFGKSSSRMDEDLTQVASLSHIGGSNRLNITLIALTFLSSFIVFIICSLIVYFTAHNFIDNASSISNGIYTLSPAFASLALAFSQSLRFYYITHSKASSSYCFSGSSLYANPFVAPDDNITTMIEQGIGMLFLALSSFSTGMWSEDGGADAFFKDKNLSFDTFEDVFPRDTTRIAQSKTLFERLATANFAESVDLVTGYLSSLMFLQLNTYQAHMTQCVIAQMTGNTAGLDPTYKALQAEYSGIKDLIYWFSNFSEINRTRIYFDLVEKSVLNKIGSYKTIAQICFIIVIVWQILACFFMILYMINRSVKIKQSLRFYHFMSPEIILQNQAALKLIETGSQLNEKNEAVYSSDDYIVSQIDQGIVVTQKNLSITSYNNSFVQKIQMADEDLDGMILTDAILKDGKDKSWEQFIQHVNDALIGRHKPQFSENVSVQFKSGQTSHFRFTATCLTSNGIPNEREIHSIEKIAFIFEDNTEMFMREQMILQEKKHLSDMLANVMPTRIVHSFEANGEGISFVVQSVSIGLIRVHTSKKFDQDTTDEFTFYNDIFSRFDEELKEFDLLTKVNTFVHTYTYIGGLFSEVNKPERHAEESIKFALKLLKLKPELSEKYGCEISLTFGVHTGGPVVAGVMSLSKPTFQIIGSVCEMANQLKTIGVQDQICISRAVYELIFSAGFNVQERGDTTIRGGKVIPTYLVKL